MIVSVQFAGLLWLFGCKHMNNIDYTDTFELVLGHTSKGINTLRFAKHIFEGYDNKLDQVWVLQAEEHPQGYPLSPLIATATHPQSPSWDPTPSWSWNPQNPIAANPLKRHQLVIGELPQNNSRTVVPIGNRKHKMRPIRRVSNYDEKRKEGTAKANRRFRE
jgi:hypothetical protein